MTKPALPIDPASMHQRAWVNFLFLETPMDTANPCFEQMYDEYKTPLFKYLVRLVGDLEQAEDLTQDTFVKAFRAMRYSQDATLNVPAWLYRIATNTAYDALRRRRLITWLPLQEHGSQEPADVESADPQQTYGTTELVRAALARLPQHYREALLLQIQAGFSCKEVARALGIGERSVRMLLLRARRAFRRQYAQLAHQ